MTDRKEKCYMRGVATIKEIDPETGAILSEQTRSNMIVDEGAEYVRNLINPATSVTSGLDWVLIGITGQALGEEDPTDDQLTDQKDARELGSPSGHMVADGKKITWKDFIFHQGAGKDGINEMCIATGNNSVSDTMLNRIIFAPVDNLNNDLLVSYELEVLSG